MKIGALNSSLRKPLSATVKKYAEMGIQGMQIQITPEHLIFSDARLGEMHGIVLQTDTISKTFLCSAHKISVTW